MKITKNHLESIIREELAYAKSKSVSKSIPLGEVYNAHVYQGSVDPYLVRAVDILEEEAEEMAQAAKTMAAAPSTEPASGYADFVAKKAKVIMDMVDIIRSTSGEVRD